MQTNSRKTILFLMVTTVFSMYVFTSRLSEWRVNIRIVENIISHHFGESGTDWNSKPIVVLLFSPYNCFRCLAEVEAWNRVHRRYPNRFQLLGVARIENESLLKRFATKRDIGFDLIVDSTGLISKNFAAKIGIPTKLLYQNGELVKMGYLGVGSDSTSEKTLLNWLANEVKN